MELPPDQTMVFKSVKYVPIRTGHVAFSRDTSMAMEILDGTISGVAIGESWIGCTH